MFYDFVKRKLKLLIKTSFFAFLSWTALKKLHRMKIVVWMRNEMKRNNRVGELIPARLRRRGRDNSAALVNKDADANEDVQLLHFVVLQKVQTAQYPRSGNRT